MISGLQNTNGFAFQMKTSCTVTIVRNITKVVHLYKSYKCLNFQHSNLICHVLSKEHQLCFNIPALQKDLEECMVNLDRVSRTSTVKNNSQDGPIKDGVVIQQWHTGHDVQLRNCSPVWPAPSLKTKVNESPFVTLLID